MDAERAERVRFNLIVSISVIVFWLTGLVQGAVIMTILHRSQH